MSKRKSLDDFAEDLRVLVSTYHTEDNTTTSIYATTEEARIQKPVILRLAKEGYLELVNSRDGIYKRTKAGEEYLKSVQECVRKIFC